MTSPLRTGTITALLPALALIALSRPVAACVLEPLRLHHSDASLARIDTAPPQRPVVLAAEAYRRSGLTCGEDVCVANNCGDLGGVAVALSAGDDQTSTRDIGFRLELVDGDVPPALRRMLGVDLAGPTPLRVQLSFDDVPSVNATLRVVAIDAAGNESAPSEPFRVGFDGCTLAAMGDQCEQDYDADAEFAASGGTLVVAAGDSAAKADGAALELIQTDAVALSSGGGCSLPNNAGRVRSALSWFLPALIGAVAARRRQRRA